MQHFHFNQWSKNKQKIQICHDPKQALEKARELWAYLSKDEPENQARPTSIEELIILITRESARRMVHLINYTGHTATKLPKYVRINILLF